MMILLSAGHNPTSRGTHNGDVYEHDLAVPWVQRVFEILEHQAPVEIVPTGSLREKVEYINSRPATIAVEIHFNANLNAAGSESIYFPTSKKGRDLALMVQEQFGIRNIFQPDRGVKEGWYRMDKPGVVDYAGDVDGDESFLYFVKATKCTSVIIEPEFIYNLDTIKSNMCRGCDAIAQALLEFYRENT